MSEQDGTTSSKPLPVPHESMSPEEKGALLLRYVVAEQGVRDLNFCKAQPAQSQPVRGRPARGQAVSGRPA